MFKTVTLLDAKEEIMAAGEIEYEDIYKFLHYNEYPSNMDKNQKINFRRKAHTNYMVKTGHLYYCKKGTTNEWKRVPQSRKDRDRIVEACHASLEGIHYTS